MPLLLHISKTKDPSVGINRHSYTGYFDVSNSTHCFMLDKMFQKGVIPSLPINSRYSLAAPCKHGAASACQFIPMLPHVLHR